MNPASGIPPESPDISGDRTPTWLAVAVLVGATLLAYANSFRGPFVFDDVPSILENETIRRLWPPGDVLSPPSGGGTTVSGRPILNLTLALNHAISGMDVWSYHALNLLIHLLAGLTLFGIVRRTLQIYVGLPLVGRPGLRSEEVRRQAPTLQSNATPLALVIAGLWLLHPLQTESVTYVIQRAESLMGLFFLLTLYGFVRALDSLRPLFWTAVSTLACLLGAGTKEVTAVAPVMVLLYDRTFVSGSFRAAWQRHRWRHLALAAACLPVIWSVAATGGDRGGTMGFGLEFPLVGYWLIQCEAVTRYLWLAFWPHPLVFDYGRIAPPGWGAALPWALPLLMLGPATLWALWRRPALGFLGAWFFVILAPTSLLPGVLQMIVEHRMYLPLAAVITLAAGFAAPRLENLWK